MDPPLDVSDRRRRHLALGQVGAQAAAAAEILAERTAQVVQSRDLRPAAVLQGRRLTSVSHGPLTHAGKEGKLPIWPKTLRKPPPSTSPPRTPRSSPSSEGYLTEVDGQIVPNYDLTINIFGEGDIVTGTVVRIDKDEVLVDIGYKSEGVIPVSELSIRKSVNTSDEVQLGEEIDALVMQKEDADGRLILSKKRARFEKAWKRIEEAHESGVPVQGTVIEVVKGGLILDLGVRGFLPASLVDIRRVQDLSEYVGQELSCRVIEMNRNRNNVVLSRRAVLEEERKEVRQQIIDELNVGDIVTGTISNIVDFGAFVDLDGIDGLIHISELSLDPHQPPVRGPAGQPGGQGPGPGHRPRPPAHQPGSQADPGRPVAEDRRRASHRRRRPGPRHQDRGLWRLCRDLRGHRGSRAHLRARQPPRRAARRGRLGRPAGAGQGHRDRLRPPPSEPQHQACRGSEVEPLIKPEPLVTEEDEALAAEVVTEAAEEAAVAEEIAETVAADEVADAVVEAVVEEIAAEEAVAAEAEASGESVEATAPDEPEDAPTLGLSDEVFPAGVRRDQSSRRRRPRRGRRD